MPSVKRANSYQDPSFCCSPSYLPLGKNMPWNCRKTLGKAFTEIQTDKPFQGLGKTSNGRISTIFIKNTRSFRIFHFSVKEKIGLIIFWMEVAWNESLKLYSHRPQYSGEGRFEYIMTTENISVNCHEICFDIWNIESIK